MPPGSPFGRPVSSLQKHDARGTTLVVAPTFPAQQASHVGATLAFQRATTRVVFTFPAQQASHVGAIWWSSFGRPVSSLQKHDAHPLSPESLPTFCRVVILPL